MDLTGTLASGCRVDLLVEIGGMMEACFGEAEGGMRSKHDKEARRALSLLVRAGRVG